MMFKNAGGKLARILCHPGTRTLLMMILLLCAAQVLASDAGDGSGGSGLPWEGPLKKLNNSISGPVAFSISLLGMIGAGAGLIWGGEIGAFMKVMLWLVLVISLIVFAKNLLTGTMFSGAVVAEQAMSFHRETAPAGAGG